MPFRFRRSIRIVPGIRVNVGRRGASASVCDHDEGHVRATATLPGTGISYTVTTPHGAGRRRSPRPGAWGRWLICTAAAAGVMWWLGWL
jgi:hypothetical protein